MSNSEKQDIFNVVYKHLLKQNKQSMLDEMTCAYRSPNGLSCAIGCLITDDEYISNIEGKSVLQLVEMQQLPIRLVPHAILLTELQTLHDVFNPNEWEDQLAIFAECHSFDIPGKPIT